MDFPSLTIWTNKNGEPFKGIRRDYSIINMASKERQNIGSYRKRDPPRTALCNCVQNCYYQRSVKFIRLKLRFRSLYTALHETQQYRIHNGQNLFQKWQLGYKSDFHTLKRVLTQRRNLSVNEGINFASFQTIFVHCVIEELFSVQFRKGAHIFVIIGVVVPTLLLLLPLLAHIVVNQYYQAALKVFLSCFT